MRRDVSEGAILDATVDVLLSHGYTGATTREIAAVAGVNEVTLFRRFGTKRRLVLAAVQREVAGLREASVRHTGDLEADLRRIVEQYGRLVRARARLFVVVLAESTREGELLEAVAQPMAVVDGARQLLARYQQTGELAEEPVDDALTALVGPILARGVLALIERQDQAPPPDPAVVVRRFLSGHGR